MPRCVRGTSARLVLVFLFLLFLVPLAFAVIALVVDDGLIGLVHGGLQRFAFGGLAFALAAALVPGVEQLIEPRQQLFDRRQLAGRPGLAARALRSYRPLWSGRTLRANCPARAGLALLALRTGLALRSRFSDRPRLALWTRLAARAIRPPSARMTLRSRPSGLALPPARSLSSLPSSLIVCHATAPLDRKQVT